MAITFLSGSTNPDSGSISRKETIDISFAIVDVSASGHADVIKTNYSATAQSVIVGEENLSVARMYYTPIYKEKLNYSVWLNRINKNFEELT